jgi:hypothetical protein
VSLTPENLYYECKFDGVVDSEKGYTNLQRTLKKDGSNLASILLLCVKGQIEQPLTHQMKNEK